MTAGREIGESSAEAGEFGVGDFLVLVDGSGFVFRAYHALPKLTRRSDGLPIGAVAGFCSSLLRLLQEGVGGRMPTHLAVAFDPPGPGFRNRIYPAYKANREAPPADLVPQFALVREAVRAFSLTGVELPEFEADDVIATYARQAEAAGADTCILSADKDLMQVVSDKVRMFDIIKGVEIGAPEVRGKFGVPPEQMIDLQALAGDPTDNVPGAPGIGPKTAAGLLAEYGDLDSLLERAAEIRQPRRRETLVGNREQILMSRDLVRLDVAAPVTEPLPTFRLAPPDRGALGAFLARMEFRSIARRVESIYGWQPLPSSPASAAPEADVFSRKDYETIDSAERLREWVRMARDLHVVAVDTETSSLDEMRADLVGVSLALAPNRACYVPIGHRAARGDLLAEADGEESAQIPMCEALAILRPLLEDASVLKVGHNLKYDMKVLAERGIAVAPIDDTMLMSYVLHAGLHRHSLDEVSKRVLGHEPESIQTLIGRGRKAVSFAEVPVGRAAAYAAEDADMALRLRSRLRPSLSKRRLTGVYETLERPMAPVLADMERIGLQIDSQLLHGISGELQERLLALAADIHGLAGETFNVASPPQLGTVLFERMGLPGGVRSGKSGNYQTDVRVLETLAMQGHEIAARVLDWRHFAKLKGTYADALPKHVHPRTGRVHTSFSLVGTTTGRLSSSDPNLQNIPVRTPEGRRIREAFVARPGWTLVSLDYSQIELRMLAHVADVDALRAAFRDGADIHAMTASEMFEVPVEGMDPQVRRQAKAINFGVIYGISAFGLASQLKITRQKAQSFIDAYFERFPGIRAYMRRTVEFAKKHGYVETPFGRRVHAPEIKASGPRQRFQERASINAPIQGGAADIIRRAMVRIPSALTAAGLQGRMILQIHDELLFEAPEDEADEIVRLAGGIMERAAEPAVELSVPIIVDAGRGANWAEAH